MGKISEQIATKVARLESLLHSAAKELRVLKHEGELVGLIDEALERDTTLTGTLIEVAGRPAELQG